MANSKIEITELQKKQFNLMLKTLKRISKEYSTPAQIKKNSNKDYGLDSDEALEYAYENIQNDAKYAIKAIKELK